MFIIALIIYYRWKMKRFQEVLEEQKNTEASGDIGPPELCDDFADFVYIILHDEEERWALLWSMVVVVTAMADAIIVAHAISCVL